MGISKTLCDLCGLCGPVGRYSRDPETGTRVKDNQKIFEEVLRSNLPDGIALEIFSGCLVIVIIS